MPLENMITVENLVNRFGTQVVHDNLCLNIRRDEIVGVVGGSGSGKSVLMRSILGLQQPTSGTITVMGQEIKFHKPGPTKNWGVLFQAGALLSNLTVQQNVELPMALYSDMPVETRHELASLKLLMTGLSLTVADKYPSELSGGMKKRVSLARALALEPKVLFLDEPTAGLDPIAATEFDELITYLHDNLDLTIMMITHDVDSLFGICDRVAVLVDKKVVIGTMDEILKSEHPWIKQYFGVPRAQRARYTATGNNHE
jgi:phospholipid/cholesterol/gamma-HCH transport system ATP-binding protein